MTSRAVIRKHMDTPEIQLKGILVALRKVNDISAEEMSRYLKISKTQLYYLENSPEMPDFYVDRYIDGLEEYIACGAARKMPFRQALMIYSHQRKLYKYSSAYKIALFGHIYYDQIYANMDAKKEDTSDKISDEDSEENVTFVEFESSFEEEPLWNAERYESAFYILKCLRDILDVKLSVVAESIGFSKAILEKLEQDAGNYHGHLNVRKIVKEYSRYIDECLKSENPSCSVIELINYSNSHGYTEKSRLQMMKWIMNKLFE